MKILPVTCVVATAAVLSCLSTAPAHAYPWVDLIPESAECVAGDHVGYNAGLHVIVKNIGVVEAQGWGVYWAVKGTPEPQSGKDEGWTYLAPGQSKMIGTASVPYPYEGTYTLSIRTWAGNQDGNPSNDSKVFTLTCPPAPR